MSQELLSQLASEGVLARSGAFALDEAKAREKMGKFQLQHPHGYVLEFFQAAVLLGAERVEVKVDSDELWMSWRGVEAIEHDHLQSMYASVFQVSSSATEEALKHLAIGMNAASTLDLSVQEMRCVGKGGKVLRRTQAGDLVEIVEVEAREEESAAGTLSIYLKERFRPAHISEFFSRMVRDVEEVTLLRDRCRFSGVGLVLNGQEMNTSFARSGEFALCETYEIEQGRIWLGLRPEVAGLDVEFLQHGVIADDSIQLKIGGLGADVLVESAGFKKDISRASLVRDEHYQHIVRSEIVSCVHETMARYLEEGEGIDPDFRASELGSLIFAVSQFVSKRPLTPGEQRMYAMAKREPLFRLASRVTGEATGGLEWVSLEELLAMMKRASQETLFYSHDNFAEVESERVVLRAAQTHVRGGHDTRLAMNITHRPFLKSLATMLNMQAEDATSYLQVRKVGMKNERIWERSFARAPFNQFEGEVRSLHQSTHHVGGEWLWLWARSRSTSKETRVTFYRDRKPLCHLTDQLDELFPGLTLHVEMPIEMNLTFSQILYTVPKNQKVLGEVLKSFPSFMEVYGKYLTQESAFLNDGARACVLRYLSHAAAGTLRDYLRFKDMRVSWEDGEEHAHWRLAEELESHAPAQRLEALSKLNVFGALPLFAAMRCDTMSVTYLSLVEVEQQMRAQRGKLRYIPREPLSMNTLHKLDASQRKEQFVLLMRPEDRDLWEALFSVYLLEDLSEEVERRLAYQAFLKRPVVIADQPLNQYIKRKTFNHDRGRIHVFLRQPPYLSELISFGNQGVVEIAKDQELEVQGVVFRGREPRGQLDVTLLYEERELETLRIDDFMLALAEVRVECDRYRVNDDYQRLIKDRPYQQLMKKIQESAQELAMARFEDLVKKVAHLTEREHGELWGTLFRVHSASKRGELGGFKHLSVYDRAKVFELQRVGGRTELVDLYEILALIDESEQLYYLDAGEEAHPDLLAGSNGVLRFPCEPARRMFEHHVSNVRLKHCALTESTKRKLAQSRAAFLALPTVKELDRPTTPYGASVLRSEVLLLPGHWQVAMFWWLDDREHDSMLGGIRIDMMYEQRILQSVVKFLSVGRLSVTVNAQDLHIDPEYTGFIKNTQFYELIDLIEGQVSARLLSWIEDRARDFEQIDKKERTMWMRYALQLRKEEPRTVSEARQRDAILAMPLFRTVGGDYYCAEDVQEMLIRHNGSRFQYVDESSSVSVSAAKQQMVFRVERDELPLLRKIFNRLLFLPYQEVSVPKPMPSVFADPRDAQGVDAGEQSEREPDFRPEAMSERPVQTPRERVLEQIRAHHRKLRTHRHGEVSLLDRVIDRIEILPISRAGVDVIANEDRVRVDPEHVALSALLAGSSDELLYAVLMSSIYSAINIEYGEVTDEHEEHFLLDISMA